MKIPESFRLRLQRWAARRMVNTPPDRVIGDRKAPYMHRWYVIPRNPFFNIYLHKFFQSDDDRALHDHPWFNCSILIKGRYIEWVKRFQRVTYDADGQWAGYHEKNESFPREEGHIYFRSPWRAHRVQLISELVGREEDFTRRIKRTQSVVTLFITGPVLRRWGFHCPKGWRYHKDFTSVTGNISSIGRGCE